MRAPPGMSLSSSESSISRPRWKSIRLTHHQAQWSVDDFPSLKRPGTNISLEARPLKRSSSTCVYVVEGSEPAPSTLAGPAVGQASPIDRRRSAAAPVKQDDESTRGIAERSKPSHALFTSYRDEPQTKHRDRGPSLYYSQSPEGML